ncbi:hypothetical protein P154DRAFT_535876 [Amniculicola lignicola CBS 123094]|uniref:Uncharacterized protein n=1 Tax=Amniculicola lignicola CBS 123094 TaxID=1392246 RepID=A0A6A5WFR8_9PLEO|nr:hypothetical protein P154DRAFT_535876 [Amniculicola lignicola CBS 123094]
MHPTTILASLFLAATSVLASPSSSLESRQVGTIYARFYADGGCHEPWLEDTVYVDDHVDTSCKNNGPSLQYGSVFFSANGASRTLRVYESANCNEGGRYYDLLPGVNNCFAQKAASSKFL